MKPLRHLITGEAKSEAQDIHQAKPSEEKPLDLSATIERALAISRILPPDHNSLVTLGKALDEAINAEMTGDQAALSVHLAKLNQVCLAIEISGGGVSAHADYSETIETSPIETTPVETSPADPAEKVNWLDRDRITNCLVCGSGSYWFDENGFALCSLCHPVAGIPTRWLDLPLVRKTQSMPGKIISLHRSGGKKTSAVMLDHASLEKMPEMAISGEIPTLAEYIAIAQDVCRLLSADDADRKHIEGLIVLADQSETDLDNLAVQTVAIYAKRVNTKYRPAIFGGFTWQEIHIDHRKSVRSMPSSG